MCPLLEHEFERMDASKGLCGGKVGLKMPKLPLCENSPLMSVNNSPAFDDLLTPPPTPIRTSTNSQESNSLAELSPLSNLTHFLTCINLSFFTQVCETFFSHILALNHSFIQYPPLCLSLIDIPVLHHFLTSCPALYHSFIYKN